MLATQGLGALLRLREAGFDVDARLENGEPEDVIARSVESQPNALLVMGAYGHSRIRSYIIGSTTSFLNSAPRISPRLHLNVSLALAGR